MKKTSLILLVLCVACIFCVALVACGPNVPPNTGNNNQSCTHNWQQWQTTIEPTCEADGTQERTCSLCNEKQTQQAAALGHSYNEVGVCTVCNAQKPTNEPLTFSGVVFDSQTVTYSGKEQAIYISGTLPQGASVKYQNNSGTDVGTYNATATVSCEGYTTLTLNAVLTIEQASFSGLSLPNKTVTYNGQEHFVLVQGNLPQGAQVSYSNNVGTEVGTYQASATISLKGYQTLTLNATLTITVAEFAGISFEDKTVIYSGEQQSIVVSGTLPQGASVEYQNNSGTNVGTYEATATITNEGYTTLVLNAILTINKADFEGITLPGKAFVKTSASRSLEVEGELPQGTTVTYSGNGQTEAGIYTVTATLTNPNYNALTLTAIMKINDVADVAEAVVNKLINRPEPWTFMPESMAPTQMALDAMPVNNFDGFASFVDVQSISNKSIGKQFAVVYQALNNAEKIVKYVDNVFDVAGDIASVYQTFINTNPDNYASFSGEAGGFKFKIELQDDHSVILAGNSTVSIELTYDEGTQTRTGRLQLTDGAAIKYVSTANTLQFAMNVEIAGVGYVYQLSFAREDGVVSGTLYECMGTESNNIKTTAHIVSDENHTRIISDKRESDDLTITGSTEVYNSKTGEFIGGEIKETVNKIAFDTFWFNLSDVSGFETIKVLDEKVAVNARNADSIFVNGSETVFENKDIGGIGGDMFSRRYDIEMKEVSYIVKVVDGDEVTYQTQTTLVPMLFVQNKSLGTLGTDILTQNPDEFSSAPVVVEGLNTTINTYFAAILDEYVELKANCSYTEIKNFIGTANSFFDQTAEEQ